MYRRSDLDADLLRLIDVLGGDVSRWPSDRAHEQGLVDLARFHRVDGLIDELVRTAQIRLDKADAAELAGASLRAEHRQSVKDSDLAALLESLDDLDAGLQVMVLKGWWTSQSCYELRSDRRYSDLDIWISPRSPTSAGTVAEYLRQGSGPSAAAYDTMLDKNLMHNAGISFKGGLVEIHKNPYGLKVDPDGLVRLWGAHARSTEFSGRAVFVPSSELALLIACVNYTRDCFPQLYQLIDVHRLSQSVDLVWSDFWQLCDEQGLEHFARGALSLSVELFEMPRIPGLQRSERWRSWWTSTNRVLGGNAPLGSHVPAQLLAEGGTRRVLELGLGWVAPPAAYWEVRAGRNVVAPSLAHRCINRIRRWIGHVVE